MTLEELKSEAKRQGYKLVKIPEKVVLSSCLCGEKRGIKLWVRVGQGNFFKCSKCGFEGPCAKGERQAKIAWNKAVAERKKRE